VAEELRHRDLEGARPVGDVQTGHQDLLEVAGKVVEQRPGGHGEHREHRVVRREQAQHAAVVEAPETDPALALPTLEQQRGDQVGAHDEERVHVDEGARTPGLLHVGRHHAERHRAAQPIQRRAIAQRVAVGVLEQG
jgi:hypothetical protein